MVHQIWSLPGSGVVGTLDTAFYIIIKIKITNLLVSTVARISGNCNLISCVTVGCHDCMVLYVIIISKPSV